MMFINIITACSRPNNLEVISKSINIPSENYRWIIVYDGEEKPSDLIVPENCEFYTHKDIKSRVGNSQKNFALDIIDSGYVYFNDDDTLIHPELWDSIKDRNNDFISFKQNDNRGRLRLHGEVGYQKIDSHNFILTRELIGDSRWILDKYEADGLFAIECYNKSKSFIKVDKVLSIYNQLR
jgi:hypothetical protein